MTDTDPQGDYYTSGPQERVVMHQGQIVGFAVSTAGADQIAQSLQTYERVHVCTICSPRRAPYRVGRSLGRTVYRLAGARPSKKDDLVGIMESRDLAEVVVAALNQQYNHH